MRRSPRSAKAPSARSRSGASACRAPSAASPRRCAPRAARACGSAPINADCGMRLSPSSVRYESISRPSRRLQICRIGGVLFDLAPQAIDQDIDRSLLRRAARSRQRLTRNDRAGIGAEQAKHFALTFGNADRLVAGAQLPALEREGEWSEAHDGLLGAADRRGPGASEHRADPQEQLARLERFGEIVVDANF